MFHMQRWFVTLRMTRKHKQVGGRSKEESFGGVTQLWNLYSKLLSGMGPGYQDINSSREKMESISI